MKPVLLVVLLYSFLFFAGGQSSAWVQQNGKGEFFIEKEAEIAKQQPGPHGGGGVTIGYSFFDQVKGYKTAFKKRVLKPGSSIGNHLQQEDEIYYILSGTGEMIMNGKSFRVKPGDAILTRPGNTHSLFPSKGGELTLIIVYEKSKVIEVGSTE